MELSTILALIGFSTAMSITPGPNNMMLMASGANFGVRRSLPHMLGVALGFVFLGFCVGLGLAEIFERYPIIQKILTVVSIGYLLFLAYKIATAAPPENKPSHAKPMTFFQACLFQWVNPKAVYMAVTAITLYTSTGALWEVVVVVLIFGAVNFPCISCWVVLGTQLRRLFRHPKHLRFFNIFLALLLVSTIVPVLY